MILPLLIGLLSCAEPPPPPPTVRPVRTQVVEEVGAALEGTFSGTTRAGDEAALSFRTGGTIDEVLVAVGATVRAGDLLARLDDSDLRLQHQQAQASVAQADANAQLAGRSLSRVEQLYVTDNASAADVDSARANNDSARAGLISAVRQRDLAKRQLDAAQLTATRDGVVAQVLAQANENVGAGTPVLVLTPDEELEITVAVSAQWVERLGAGVVATAVFPELDGAARQARVTEVGGSSQSAGSFPVTVELLERDAALRPGLVAEVTLALPASDERRIELPLSAIAEDEGGRFVWRVKPDGERHKVERVDVQTGELTGDGLVVTGVQSGDVIVTAGISKLHADRAVRLEAR